MVGLPIYNAYKGQKFRGNGDILKFLWEAYCFLIDKYEYSIYADGADTFFLKAFQPPANKIIFSTEKQVWPQLPALKNAYDKYYSQMTDFKYSPWLFLNGGNCCGPTQLLAEFYGRYNLKGYAGEDVNGQKELSEAFLQAKKEGFPIYLDTECEYFQTVAFENPGDFRLDDDGLQVINNITGTKPAVLHGNGRTDMTAIYKRYNL
jgi:hypothetical protein